MNGTPKPNPVAFDSPPNDVVTHRILSNFSQLVPQRFEICHLPADVLSFAHQAVQMLESSTIQKRNTPTSNTTDIGAGGAPSLKSYCPGEDRPLKEYPMTSVTSSHGPSLRFTGDPNLLLQEKLLGGVTNQWRSKLLHKQPGLWQRRVGTISNQVPFTSRETVQELCSRS